MKKFYHPSMSKDDFLKELFALYPNSHQGNSSKWLSVYAEKLPHNADYDALLDTVMREFSGASMPKPAWLLERVTYKKEDIPNSNEIWTGTVYVRKNGIPYEFAYGGVAGKLEAVKESLLAKGFTIEKVS
jgi:hypothetical protein